MVTVTTSSPAILQQPCKHHATSRGTAVPHCPPRLRVRRRSYRQVTTSATGGRVEAPVGSPAAGEQGDSIRRLQNGPDVRGVALEGEKGRPVDLTPLAVEVIAESFGEWLRDEQPETSDKEPSLRVSVSRDPRLSGPRLSAALFAGLARAGCDVFDMGLATTPACFMSTILPRFNYDASIMVTLA